MPVLANIVVVTIIIQLIVDVVITVMVTWICYVCVSLLLISFLTLSMGSVTGMPTTKCLRATNPGGATRVHLSSSGHGSWSVWWVSVFQVRLSFFGGV